MRQVRWSSDALKDVSPVKYAAILHSRPSNDVFGEEFTDSFQGYYEVLASQHLPVEIVSEKGVQEGALDGFAVLVLPNAVCLADATVNAIEEFVNAGGGLVASYRTGMCDEDGNLRSRPAISDLAGIDPSRSSPGTGTSHIQTWMSRFRFPASTCAPAVHSSATCDRSTARPWPTG